MHTRLINQLPLSLFVDESREAIQDKNRNTTHASWLPIGPRVRITVPVRVAGPTYSSTVSCTVLVPLGTHLYQASLLYCCVDTMSSRASAYQVPVA
jgi:hypothetical protein